MAWAIFVSCEREIWYAVLVVLYFILAIGNIFLLYVCLMGWMVRIDCYNFQINRSIYNFFFICYGTISSIYQEMMFLR